MTDKEKFYDDEIAPALLELAEKCKAHGLSMLAVVEYAPDETARTQVLQTDAGLAMVMLAHCAKMGTNVDGYFIGLSRYAKEKGIPTDSSMVFRLLNGPTP